MEFRDNAKIDQSRVRYGGGSGRGARPGRGGIAVGGGIGGLIVLLLMLFVPQLGINPSDVGGGAVPPPPQQQGDGKPPAGQPECKTGADIEKNPDCRWPAYTTSVDDFWATQVEGYRKSVTQLFSGQIQTGCGAAGSEMGPFYCPADETVYIDTEFMGKLLDMVGAKGGYAAEAYIVAHEYGHHVQNLTGQMEQARRGAQAGPDSAQVRLELQADCYAGIWFHHDQRNPEGLIKEFTEDDLFRIYDAARAVGDDHVQKTQNGQIHEENWTHGSSEQRQKWLKTGFETGDPVACDTFKTDDLG